MKYKRLGKTGLQVSRICIGCMSFGTSEWQDWVTDEEESIKIIKKAFDYGINFFDTADAYSNGYSEVVLGKALKQHNIPRSQVVIATKCYFQVYDNMKINSFAQSNETPTPQTVNQRGNSRKHIFEAVEASLKRLGTDYIDLYQIHRWDYNTPIEETMEALHDLVKMGKVRYIGASSMSAWQFQKANTIAEKNGWTKFSCMQNLYNLIYREEEREMIPYLIDAGIGMICWSPLARGALAGKSVGSTKRSVSDNPRKNMIKNIDFLEDIVKAANQIAEKYNATSTQIALAWLFSKNYLTAPIVGCGKEKYLDEAVAALDITLTPEEIEELEKYYQPRPIFGYTPGKLN
ncbi:aldo/keto reductase [Anaeromyces robustus]|uniref:Aldo/keto reductase n=1 Tax=Anaeromyces robustus TaxID=1754192 RepID=A0A1Y1X7P2_9FUNG|nr:aldo/keto reductase [Anaeromyces robustus]|eukprot:ORX81779.1 aldo/keto reductase [Anaeromyces robustus]